MTRPPHEVAGSAARRVADRAMHARILAARMLAGAVSLTAAAGIARLMWALPWQLDALLTVTVSATWCLWLENNM
jgi:hypothetical protein